MSIKPILFNTDMVRAILDGRKGCTRRIVKGFIPNDAKWGYTAFTPKGCISCRGTFADGYGEKFFKLPCEPGDILYVRETWKRAPNGYYYYEDWQRDDIADITKWKPSIHMPKEGARCSCLHPVPDCAGNKTAFVNIWNSTIKKSDLDWYGWSANPWVWVIEFERCEKPKEEN